MRVNQRPDDQLGIFSREVQATWVYTNRVLSCVWVCVRNEVQALDWRAMLGCRARSRLNTYQLGWSSCRSHQNTRAALSSLSFNRTLVAKRAIPAVSPRLQQSILFHANSLTSLYTTRRLCLEALRCPDRHATGSCRSGGECAPSRPPSCRAPSRPPSCRAPPDVEIRRR